MKEVKKQGGLNAEIQSRIGHQLRAMYDDVVRQGVPDRFAELIKKLDGPEAAAAQIDDPEKKDGGDRCPSQTRFAAPFYLRGPPAARQAATGPARSVDTGRRLRLLLRGRGRHLRLRGRHHQEPRQPRALEIVGAALCRWRRGFRSR